MEKTGETLRTVSGERVCHTVEEICALSGGRKAELFDGEMAADAYPTTTHQSVIGYLVMEISVYLKAKQRHCRAVPAPFAVFLKDDGRNFVQPDISVICDREKLDEQGCHGAPDWVIEVLSPASRRLDCGKKLSVYIAAGVREYWIVDPEKKVIAAYYLEQPDIPVIYRFGDMVRPGIFEDLIIDSSQLNEVSHNGLSAGFEKETVFPPRFSAGGTVKDGEPYEGGMKAPAENAGGQEKEPGAGGKQPETSPGRMTSVDEVRAYAEEHFAELVEDKNKGQLMKAVMSALKGRTEGRIIAEAVAELCR